MSTVKAQRQQKGRSISTKIGGSIMAILIPSLIVLIVVSCFMAASAIATLNDKVLDAQTDYAVSIVDGFFDNKVTAASMFENDVTFQDYFLTVRTPQDINAYANRDVVVDKLANALERMSGQNVQQAWLVDPDTDTYLLSTGETVAANLAGTTWGADVLSGKTVVSEPFLDPATGNQIIAIVAPVYAPDGANVIGLVGFDVFIDSLAESLAAIKIGQEGYLELLDNSSNYIYSEDPTAMGKNVTELDITDDYKQKVQSRYTGMMEFSYAGVEYSSLFRLSETTGWLAIATIPVAEVNATRNQLLLVQIVLSIVIVLALILIILSLIRKSMKPLASISKDMEQFADGNLGVNVEIHSNDEIGRLADSVRTAIQTLKAIIDDISYVLSEISSGNLALSVTGEYKGDLQPIRKALEHIIQSLNNTMSQITMSSDQVSSGSEQVSNGAQALSQGATEQASSIEELAATINEISGQISVNAENVVQASGRMNSVGNEVEESNRRMQDMLAAIEEIRSTAGEIGKIIKTIEDIAFQTNILALNAAVEAARAGVAGKGFAVVADEVRSLANKSSEASKNTSTLIENALHAVENGTSIADETARALTAVVQGVDEVGKTIDQISTAFIAQADSIKQVTQGVDQISSVVQTNSATAEQSAAASEELSGQAQMLRDLVSEFKIKNEAYGTSEMPVQPPLDDSASFDKF